jgi:2-(1,2-epoxy-1,2-dihydrophenyl)acetyl-CoA isomerase
MGLANQSVTPGTAEAVAKQLAVELAQGATVALGLSKQLLEAATCMNLRELAQVEAFAQAVTYSTEDHLAARAAFRAKSAPTFTGR